MKASFLTLLLLLATTPAPAQDAKQQLNDQMYEAVRRGDTAAVTALLDKGADDAKFRYAATALFKAAERGNADMVKILLARGADATVSDTFYNANAMTWALARILMSRSSALCDPTSVEDVLMTGVSNGNVALVEVALARGGAKAESLTAALASSLSDKDKAAIDEGAQESGSETPA